MGRRLGGKRRERAGKMTALKVRPPTLYMPGNRGDGIVYGDAE
jgi:hypothetical protein